MIMRELEANNSNFFRFFLIFASEKFKIRNLYKNACKIIIVITLDTADFFYSMHICSLYTHIILIIC